MSGEKLILLGPRTWDTLSDETFLIGNMIVYQQIVIAAPLHPKF